MWLLGGIPVTKSRSEITLTVRLITGELLEIKFHCSTTAKQLRRSIVQYLNIEEPSWILVLHVGRKTTILKEHERLADYLVNTRDAYLSLEPVSIGG
jgi:hypothetical protein